MVLFSFLINSESTHADSLIKNYPIAPRYEPYGVADIGYPQICLRTNMSGERVDMQGILDELSNKYDQSKLFGAITNLAASGQMGHVWTLIFDSDSKDDWRSWSFRNPASPLGNALNYKNYYDSPERHFNYQYCVSATGKKIDSPYLEKNVINPLINESRMIASAIMPDTKLPEGNGIYTPLTSCVWFAAKMFNMITDSSIPYEQPIDGEKIASLMGNSAYSQLEYMVDTSVVAEAISKRLKYSFSLNGNEQYFYLNNGGYVSLHSYERSYYGDIKSNMFYNSDLAPFYNGTKTVIIDNGEIFMFGYNGLLSSYNYELKDFYFRKRNITDVFPYTDLDAKKILSTMPIYKVMPDYYKGINKHLIFTADGDVYLYTRKGYPLKKTDYIEQYIPTLKPYIKRIIGTSLDNNGHLFVYLTNNKFITLELLTMTIVQPETDMQRHPKIGEHFKLQ